MALLTSYPTEVLVKKERRYGVTDAEGGRTEWFGQWRTVTITTSRFVFSSLDEATSYLRSVLNTEGIKSDGVARIINEAGWAECIIATSTEGEWQDYGQ